MSPVVVAVVAGVAAAILCSLIIAPVVGAAIAGRTLQRRERELLEWAGLGVFMALFLLAIILIGAR